MQACSNEIDTFMTTLRGVLTRLVTQIVVRTTWGEDHSYANVESARKAIQTLAVALPSGRFLRYELRVKYSNGDSIEANFELCSDALDFLSRIA